MLRERRWLWPLLSFFAGPAAVGLGMWLSKAASDNLIDREAYAASTELWDPRTERPTRGPRMLEPPGEEAPAVRLDDGSVLVLGYEDAERFDAKRGRFVAAGDFRRGLHGGPWLVPIVHGAVAITEAGELERYDLRTNRWKASSIPATGSTQRVWVECFERRGDADLLLIVWHPDDDALRSAAQIFDVDTQVTKAITALPFTALDCSLTNGQLVARDGRNSEVTHVAQLDVADGQIRVQSLAPGDLQVRAPDMLTERERLIALKTKRKYPFAVTLRDGRVLIGGGTEARIQPRWPALGELAAVLALALAEISVFVVLTRKVRPRAGTLLLSVVVALLAVACAAFLVLRALPMPTGG